MTQEQIIDAKSIEIKRLRSVCNSKDASINVLLDNIYYLALILERNGLLTDDYETELSQTISDCKEVLG